MTDDKKPTFSIGVNSFQIGKIDPETKVVTLIPDTTKAPSFKAYEPVWTFEDVPTFTISISDFDRTLAGFTRRSSSVEVTCHVHPIPFIYPYPDNADELPLLEAKVGTQSLPRSVLDGKVIMRIGTPERWRLAWVWVTR